MDLGEGGGTTNVEDAGGGKHNAHFPVRRGRRHLNFGNQDDGEDGDRGRCSETDDDESSRDRLSIQDNSSDGVSGSGFRNQSRQGCLISRRRRRSPRRRSCSEYSNDSWMIRRRRFRSSSRSRSPPPRQFGRRSSLHRRSASSSSEASLDLRQASDQGGIESSASGHMRSSESEETTMLEYDIDSDSAHNDSDGHEQEAIRFTRIGVFPT